MKSKKFSKKSKSSSTSEKAPEPQTDVFAIAENFDEAMDLRAVVKEHCEWPLLFEMPDGRYEISGLTRSGGRVNDEILMTVLESINQFRNARDNKSKKVAVNIHLKKKRSPRKKKATAEA